MKTLFTINLGCKVNLYEINAVANQLIQNGYKLVNDINNANVVLINTCSVTNKADAKSRNMINRAKHAKLNPIVIVMGCFSQVNKQWFKNNTGDIVIGTKYRTKIAKYLKQFQINKKRIIKIDNLSLPFEEFNCFCYANNTRAFLKIQDGCDYFCTYCLIPYCRGRQRAMKHDHILKAIKWYVNHNYKEIILTGVNTAGYKNGFYTFYDLLKDINNLPGKFRVRISSLEPFQISEKIINLLASNPDRWANQIHLCLQSANDDVLKRMNRKYKIKNFIKMVKYIRSKMPGVSITTDYIVGFADETQKEFNSSLKNLRKIKFSNMNVFIYSRRNGTIADKKYKNDINPTIARNRYNQIIDLNNQCRHEYLKTFIGKTLDVLVEKSTIPNMHGYASEFIKVVFKSNVNLHNKIAKVKITSIKKDGKNYYLFGTK